MGTVSSRVRRQINGMAVPTGDRDAQTKLLIPLTTSARSASSNGALGGLGELAAEGDGVGLADMPAEVVDHIASFLPSMDSLQFAATDTSLRNALEARTLSAALRIQARNVKELGHFFALFALTATLPPRLREQPLGALARSLPPHGHEWHSARMMILQACDHLPPDFRASPLIALAGIIGTSGPLDRWQTNLDCVLELVSTLSFPARTAALCALADTEGSGLMRTTTAFDSILDAAKGLPGRLRAQVFEHLAQGLRHMDQSHRDERGVALLSAGEDLTPAQRFSGLSALPEASRWMSKLGAARLLQGLCNAAIEMPPDEQAQMLLEIASNLNFSSVSHLLIPVVLWLSDTAIQLKPKYQARLQKELFLKVAHFEGSKQKAIFEKMYRNAARFAAPEQRALISALHSELMGPSTPARIIRMRLTPEALAAAENGILALRRSLDEREEK